MMVPLTISPAAKRMWLLLQGFFHGEHNDYYLYLNCGEAWVGANGPAKLHCLTDQTLRGNGG